MSLAHGAEYDCSLPPRKWDLPKFGTGCGRAIWKESVMWDSHKNGEEKKGQELPPPPPPPPLNESRNLYESVD